LQDVRALFVLQNKYLSPQVIVPCCRSKTAQMQRMTLSNARRRKAALQEILTQPLRQWTSLQNISGLGMLSR
jgi:hypothetical protein